MRSVDYHSVASNLSPIDKRIVPHVRYHLIIPSG